MLRAFTYVSVVGCVVSAFVLYAINYDTRAIEAVAHELSSNIEKTRRDIAVLKAERALLGAPVRIEPFAAALGLRPAAGEQFQALSDNGGRLIGDE